MCIDKSTIFNQNFANFDVIMSCGMIKRRQTEIITLISILSIL